MHIDFTKIYTLQWQKSVSLFFYLSQIFEINIMINILDMKLYLLIKFLVWDVQDYL